MFKKNLHDLWPEAHSPSQCINCNGDPSYSQECPKFIMEREIQKIRATEKEYFPEAWCRYQTQNPIDFSCSFIQILKPFSGITACQTEKGTHCSVYCQVNFTAIIGNESKFPSLKTNISSIYKSSADPPRIWVFFRRFIKNYSDFHRVSGKCPQLAGESSCWGSRSKS